MTLRFEPGTAECEARMLPLCHATRFLLFYFDFCESLKPPLKVSRAWQWRKKIQSRGKSFINSIQPFLLSNLDVNREITFELFFLVWSLRQQKESFLHFGLPSVFAPMFNLILKSDMDEIRWTLGTRRPTLTSTSTLTPTTTSTSTPTQLAVVAPTRWSADQWMKTGIWCLSLIRAY